MTNEQKIRFSPNRLLVIHFTKKNGEHRRMVCYPKSDGHTTRPDQVRVWDIEAGGYRTVTLPAVMQVLTFRARPKDRSKPLPPATPSSEEIQAAIDAIFPY